MGLRSIEKLVLDSMIYQLAIPPILAQMPRSTLEAMTGNLLGDGTK